MVHKKGKRNLQTISLQKEHQNSTTNNSLDQQNSRQLGIKNRATNYLKPASKLPNLQQNTTAQQTEQTTKHATTKQQRKSKQHVTAEQQASSYCKQKKNLQPCCQTHKTYSKVVKQGSIGCQNNITMLAHDQNAI